MTAGLSQRMNIVYQTRHTIFCSKLTAIDGKVGILAACSQRSIAAVLHWISEMWVRRPLTAAVLHLDLQTPPPSGIHFPPDRQSSETGIRLGDADSSFDSGNVRLAETLAR